MFLVTMAFKRRISWPKRSDLPMILSVGILQMATVLALINLGLARVPAGRSAILAYTMPLWVAPGGVLFLGEKLTRGKILAVILGLAGVAVMFNPFDFDWSNSQGVIGNGFLLGAAAIWAGTIVHVRGHRWTSTPLELAPWQMLLGLLPLTALAWTVEGPPPSFELSPTTLLVMFYSGPVITAFPFWASVTVSRALPAVTTSLVFLLVPVMGLLSASAILGEPLSAATVAGLLLIVAGVATVNLAGAKQ